MADSEGVRDEVGVLALHTAYANRFFPGTSVQQTRLRYALFVPWQIMTLLRDRERVQSGQACRAALEQAELNLARRLPDVDGEGTIGRRTAKAGRSVAIPPSQSYWVALGAWGILGASPHGDAPSRRELFARWGSWSEGHRGRPATDDEGRALETARSLFHQGLPELELPRFRGPAVWPHPRLRAMCEQFQPEKLAVPWLAPSMPWWPLGGRWVGAPSEKILLFSRFRAVPRAVAGLMSYDLERHLLRRSRLGFGDVTKRSRGSGFYP